MSTHNNADDAVDGTDISSQQSVAAETFARVYETFKGRECRADPRFQIAGLQRTRIQVVEPLLQPLMAASTLEQLTESAHEVRNRLIDLGVFTAVEIKLLPGSSPGRSQVFVSVQESQLVTGHTGVYGQGQDASVEGMLVCNNLFGNGEQGRIKMDYSLQHTRQMELALSRSWLRGSPWNGSLSLLQNSTNWTRQSSYVEVLRGILASLNSTDNRHRLSYELGWRHLRDPSCRASQSVLRQCGHSLKSAIRYSYSKLLPVSDSTVLLYRPVGADLDSSQRQSFTKHKSMTAGKAAKPYTLAQASSELSGLGLSKNMVRFAKQEVDIIVDHFVGNCTFETSVRAGMLTPWALPGQAWNRPTPICDRFHVGGPGSLWGFQLRGVGPVDVRRAPPAEAEASSPSADKGTIDYLGADVYATATAALLFPVPIEVLRRQNVQGQIFVQGGSAQLLAGVKRPWSNSIADFAKSTRFTMGAGLALPTVFGRLELNFCQAIRSLSTDAVASGFQIGLTPIL